MSKPAKRARSSSEQLTKREQLAAAALQGIAVNPNGLDPKRVAKLALQYADAVLNELQGE